MKLYRSGATVMMGDNTRIKRGDSLDVDKKTADELLARGGWEKKPGTTAPAAVEEKSE